MGNGSDMRSIKQLFGIKNCETHFMIVPLHGGQLSVKIVRKKSVGQYNETN